MSAILHAIVVGIENDRIKDNINIWKSKIIEKNRIKDMVKSWKSKTPCPICLMGTRECDCDNCGVWGCYDCVSGYVGGNFCDNCIPSDIDSDSE
jgi:hypothetical protein